MLKSWSLCNRKMFARTLILIFIPIISFLCFVSHSAYAADYGVITPGDAAVTGFSGTVVNGNELTIDVNGPSLRVINLPTSEPYGLTNVAKPLTVTAQNIGQVFGVALDDKTNPNIYVAATSAYGIAIYLPNLSNQSQGSVRIKKGQPGALYLPGQFGPAELGGGPNSIWRIDGTTGAVTLFANVSTPGVNNAPAALGGLAFDKNTQQLFAVDRATGLIHRFSLDGTDQGTYDHGATGLPAAGQAAVPFDPATVATIASPQFDTENPNTWGYAPEQRRVFAVTAFGNRLYYSVTGSQVWSVGIASDGSFANDARFEVDVPALNPGSEIASIAFDDQGYMYIAERGWPTGDYQFVNVASGGQNRVKRFALATPTHTSPGYWSTPGDEYAVGMPPDFKNANGGVAIPCQPNVWSTGEQLIAQINGLQGNATRLIRPANTPPSQSWFVNYYDQESDPSSRGYMGALAILKVCKAIPIPPTPPAPPPIIYCPPNTYYVDGMCFWAPICPYGTIFEDGFCIFIDCPWGYVRINGSTQCVPPPVICPYGTIYINNACVPITCPSPFVFLPNGYCGCPYHTYYNNGRCVSCPPDHVYYNGQCSLCPINQIYINGRCVPCARGQTNLGGYCLPCPANEVYYRGHCVPCAATENYVQGRCVPKKPCPKGQRYVNGQCIITPEHVCPIGQTYVRGHCVPQPQVICPFFQICPLGQIC